ncbi:hypothetical protein F5146DRAFT_1143595 [Armillaria mellea]|nr:hypothetical protein F5146DRAFT_1143595 [Armillaria mellea]
MNFNLPSSLHDCPFADALWVFGYCISHPAESNDSAMHTDAWVREAFVAWESLNHSWLMEEPGFVLDQVWADMQMYLWFAVDDLDWSQVHHSIWEFNLLVAEAFKSDVVIAPLVLDMPSPMVQPSPLLLLTPHHVGPWRMPSDDHSLPTTSPDVCSPITSPSQPMHVISSVEDDAEDLEPAHKRLHHGPSPPRIPSKEKGKGHTVSAPSQKLHTGRPHKLPEATARVAIKQGGFGEPIPKNAREISCGDLRPIGLMVPDQDFGDFVGCKGALFKREVANKVSHFMSIASLVTEICGLLHCLRQDACKMNDMEDNIPSLFCVSHLDTIELVSSLFENGVVEDFVDLEAEEAAEDEDLEGEVGPDDK